DHLSPDNLDPYPPHPADIEYVARRPPALVGDEMGIGKTITAICYANTLAWAGGRPDGFRACAIVPASVRLQWANRIREWTTIPDTRISVVSSSTQGYPHTRDNIHWTIMSYDAAASRTAFRAIVEQQCHYDLLVLDEAHYLKTPTTARTRAIFGAADRARHLSACADHVLALTGTPLPNRPREAYTLANRLCPEAIDFMSERAFNNRFNPRDRHREGVGRVHELQARLRTGFMVRHLFADAFPQLRLPLYDLIQVERDAAVRQALAAEALLDIDPETLTGADGKIDGDVSTARLLMGLAIAPHAVKYIKMLADGGDDKIVVFAWHREVLDILQNGLDKLGVCRIDGSTSEHERAKQKASFITDPGKGVMLGNILALGTGVDGLQAVFRRVVHVEPDWVFGHTVQCTARLYRAGQTAQVMSDIMVAPGSLSERVLASALRKGLIVHKALDGKVAND